MQKRDRRMLKEQITGKGLKQQGKMNESHPDIVKRSEGSETRFCRIWEHEGLWLEYCWPATGCRRIAIRYCQTFLQSNNPSLPNKARGVIRLSPKLILLILFIDLQASTPIIMRVGRKQSLWRCAVYEELLCVFHGQRTELYKGLIQNPPPADWGLIVYIA